MKRLLLSTLALSAIVAFSSAHAADKAAPVAPAAAPEMTTQEKIKAKEEEGKIAENLKATNDTCGSSIQSTVDWAAIKNAKQNDSSASGFCSAPASALHSLCSSNEAYKTSVASKVKEIKCTFGADRKIDLTNGVLTYTVDFKSSNDDDFTRDYLNTKL